MKILAIDTSGEQAGAAIIGAKNADAPYITIGEIFFNARTGEKAWTHSEVLMPGVEKLFELTRLEPREIDYVAYTNGPGSFTGLRIGAASALAIARGLGVPAIAVPTLDAMAYNALRMGTECTIVPMLDARRGQVYTALYTRRDLSGRITRETDFFAMQVDEALKHFFGLEANESIGLAEDVVFLGDGADANADIINNRVPGSLFAPANNNRQRAASVGVCALEKIHAGEEISQEIEILYIRAPQAVREAEARA